MAWIVLWSDQAVLRLTQLTDFAAERGPDQALRVVGQIREGVAMLQEQPRIAPLWRPGSWVAIRRLVVHQYVVYYEVLDPSQVVLIHSVLHSRQRPLGPQDL